MITHPLDYRVKERPDYRPELILRERERNANTHTPNENSCWCCWILNWLSFIFHLVSPSPSIFGSDEQHTTRWSIENRFKSLITVKVVNIKDEKNRHTFKWLAIVKREAIKEKRKKIVIESVKESRRRKAVDLKHRISLTSFDYFLLSFKHQLKSFSVAQQLRYAKHEMTIQRKNYSMVIVIRSDSSNARSFFDAAPKI